MVWLYFNNKVENNQKFKELVTVHELEKLLRMIIPSIKIHHHINEKRSILLVPFSRRCWRKVQDRGIRG
jgi:hypothetical protein